MWIFTPSGFLSVVQDTRHPGALLVRARCREDVEAFADAVCRAQAGARPAVQQTATRDYRWRCTVSRAVFARWLYGQAMAIDYPNFKSRVHGQPDRDRAYSEAWTAMRRFQEGRP
jgi:hypothetical protein